MMAGRRVATLASLMRAFDRFGAAVRPEDLVQVGAGSVCGQLGRGRIIGSCARMFCCAWMILAACSWIAATTRGWQ